MRLCRSQGFAGPNACVLEEGHTGAHKYGDVATALADKQRKDAARWAAIETLMILGDVELTQTEGGGYCICVEPVENIRQTAWEGNTPEEAVDLVVAQLETPNA
jgi:hypothetical protein